MASKEMKEITFEKINDTTWRDIAVQSLRGMPYEKLITDTVEGIALQPIYTKESHENHFQKKAVPFVQKIRSGLDAPGWTIAQEIYAAQDGADFIKRVKQSLDKGNEAILYNGNHPIQWQQHDLQELALIIQKHPIYMFQVQQKDRITELFELVPPNTREKVIGLVTGIDVPAGFTHVKTVGISTIKEHQAAADAVTELAIVLAKIVREAENFESFTTLMDKLAVQFAIDTDFFMEIAKLRAFRVLWHTLARSYEAEAKHIPLIGETSLRTYTKYDPQTNLLRAGNETLAAALGGIDVFTVHPHLILQETTPTSIRNARNIQLVIREEAFMNYVLDPAGGSYFIDTLTDELVQAAWGLFQEIQTVGGYQEYVDSGTLKKRLSEKYEARSTELYKGKRVLVGTNKYADPNEKVIPSLNKMTNRLAEPFENLREQFSQDAPDIILLRFGTLATAKARTDFVKGFLAIVGINPALSPVFPNAKEANAWLKENKYDYYIVCTPAKQEFAAMEDLQIPSNMWVDVAGKFTDDEFQTLQQHGVDDVIYAGLDQLLKLTAMLQKWKGGKGDDKA